MIGTKRIIPRREEADYLDYDRGPHVCDISVCINAKYHAVGADCKLV